MMRATMTDVQKAIEQLGRRRAEGEGDADGSRSFSFASSHGEWTDRSETETDHDDEELNDGLGVGEGEGWHKNARERLAMKAREANEARLAKEARESGGSAPTTPIVSMRFSAPPIDVEVSDESDDEDGHHHHGHEGDDEDEDETKVGSGLDALKGLGKGERHSDPFPGTKGAYSHIPIPEEDEEEHSEPSSHVFHQPQPREQTREVKHEETTTTTQQPLPHTQEIQDSASHIEPSEDFIVPLPDESDLPTANPTQVVFPSPPTPSRPSHRTQTPISPERKGTTSPGPVIPSPQLYPYPPQPYASQAHQPTPSPPPGEIPIAQPSPMKSGTSTTRIGEQLPFASASVPASSSVFGLAGLAGAGVSSPTPSGNTVFASPTPYISPTPSGNGFQQLPNVPMPVPSPTTSSFAYTGAGTGTGTERGTPATSMSGFKTPEPMPPSAFTSPVAGMSMEVVNGSASASVSVSGSLGSGMGSGAGKNPKEWSVEDVVSWLKAKGFDQGVCDKFIEQEITGDVLLELNAEVLKNEIGIAAFGKRVRIVNAIDQLRAPPAPQAQLSQPHSAPSATTLPEPIHINTNTNAFPQPQPYGFNYNYNANSQPPTVSSRSQSISYSQGHGQGQGQGQGQGHSHTPSMQSAQHSFTNSPLSGYGTVITPSSQHQFPSFPQQSNGEWGNGNGNGIGNGSGMNPPGSATSSAGGPGWRASDPGSGSIVFSSSADTTQTQTQTQQLGQSQSQQVGLGIGMPSLSTNGKSQKGKPSHLVLSPSDGALKASAVIDDRKSLLASEDRAVLSDSEAGHHLDAKQKRRRLFGRSTESASIKEKASSFKDTSSRNSRDVSTPVSATHSDLKEAGDEVPPMRRHNRKRSSDERKASDRLSLFGSFSSTSLGKSRKPAPRLSTGTGEKTDSEKPEKHSHTLSTFSRIRHAGEKRISSRPSTSDGTRPKDKSGSIGGERIGSPKEQALLRKRTASTTADKPRPGSVAVSSSFGGVGLELKPGQSVIEQVGTPDHNGWMRKKGDRYNTWKLRYFILKGPHLYILKSDSHTETKIKGYINITGYRVQPDENVDPGRYGFSIVHDSDKTHYFSSDEQIVIREWMKALIKATISRDYTNPVVSSSNIPTIPLTVAQTMSPAPRPPSPGARAATQRAHRRDNPNQLSSRDAQILLMGSKEKSVNGHSERTRIDSVFTNDTASTQDGQESAMASSSKKTGPVSPSRSTTSASAPPRPSREIRRVTTQNSDNNQLVDQDLIEWANSHLPQSLQMTNPAAQMYGGLALLRLAEGIKGKPASPPVPDSAFPSGPNDDKLDGLFRLFDFLLDNDVKMGTVSINDIRQGKREKIVQLLRAMRAWEEKRKAIAQSIGKGSVAAGPFMGMAGPVNFT
ncbi:hypothetical protein K474DRAFT_1629965 [Panus rudis PR-1116 ss-1]|nr:hypothetical protein K474DRAFT_1629965 [Panus rudis PR-1116 ss-1]